MAPPAHRPAPTRDIGSDHPGSVTYVDIQVDDAGVVARPHGELDLLGAPPLHDMCVAQLDRMTGGSLVVDLAAVTFLDSSGLAVLVEIHRVCNEKSTRFVVVGASARTRRLLDITRLDEVFDIR